MSYARALKGLGCDVHFWNPEDALRRVARGGRLGRLFSVFVNVEPWVRKANLELLAVTAESHPDLVLVIGTEGVRAGTLAQMKVILPDTCIYCIFPDSPHNLTTERIQCLGLFDRVISSSPDWIEPLRKLGAERAHYLPFAADSFLHKPTGRQDGNGNETEVAFIGNWRLEREVLLEQFVDFDFAIWGSDYWKTRTRTGSKLRPRWSGRPAVGEEFARVCAETKILLNVMDKVTWPGPNMRTFEQPACRAFSLSTRSPAVTQIFSEGDNIECFESAEEARDKIDFYLKNDSAREAIADRAYHLVVHGGHTYTDRAKQLMTWVKEDGLS
jgi:hypothetical protein